LRQPSAWHFPASAAGAPHALARSSAVAISARVVDKENTVMIGNVSHSINWEFEQNKAKISAQWTL
jgi:hypothetical protein